MHRSELLIVAEGNLSISQVRELVSEPDNYDVKFRLTGWDKKTYLSINLVILKVPAEAAVWQLQLDGKAATQDTTDVRCGEPFQLLVEAHDKFGNRHVPIL